MAPCLYFFKIISWQIIWARVLDLAAKSLLPYKSDAKAIMLNLVWHLPNFSLKLSLGQTFGLGYWTWLAKGYAPYKSGKK